MENTLEQQVEKLQAFKDYVHKRLNDYGIEKEPKGEHSEHGCRIGDRLDIVLNEIKPNNGWISIESEEDLPKEKIYVYLIDKIKGFDEKPYPFNPNIEACRKELLRNYSHYQQIQKPKNPIF